MTSSIGQARVLYVEDEPIIRKIISILLERAGVQVRTAGDGREGVKVALEWRPDLILMDLMMPVMNGFEATQTLRADPRTQQTPILAYSAADETGFQARALQIGMNRFISKSTPHQQLVGTVRTYLASLIGSSNELPPNLLLSDPHVE